MQIAQSKTREQFPLSEKKIIKKTITSALAMLFICLIILVSLIGSAIVSQLDQNGTHWLNMAIIGIIVFIIAITWLTYAYQRWYFAFYFYDLTPDFIQIKKGPITPREITIPYERIQDVYVDQDLLDRIFGLYDVHLSSATISSGMEAHIDGVERQVAEGLRNVLLQTVQQRISKNRSQNSNNNSQNNQ